MDVTHFWSMRTVLDHLDGGRQFDDLDHTASNKLQERGVGPGDRVYALHVGVDEPFEPMRVYLIGRVLADRHGCMTASQAATLLDCDPEDLYDAADHVVAEPGTVVAMDFWRVLPAEVLRELRFVSSRADRLDVDDEGRLRRDRQQLRGVRRLTSASAQLLEEFLAGADADLPDRRRQWRLDELMDLLDRAAVTGEPGSRLRVTAVALAAAAEEIAGGSASAAGGPAAPLTEDDAALLGLVLPLIAGKLLDACDAPPEVAVERFRQALDACDEALV